MRVERNGNGSRRAQLARRRCVFLFATGQKTGSPRRPLRFTKPLHRCLWLRRVRLTGVRSEHGERRNLCAFCDRLWKIGGGLRSCPSATDSSHALAARLPTLGINPPEKLVGPDGNAPSSLAYRASALLLSYEPILEDGAQSAKRRSPSKAKVSRADARLRAARRTK